MNVLIVAPWDQTYGGVAGVVNNLANQLQAHGHGVAFSSGETSSFLLGEGRTKLGYRQFRLQLLLPFTRSSSWLGSFAGIVLFPLALVQLLWLVRRERIDIVNVHYPGSSGVYYALCRVLSRIHLVTSVHGADFFPAGRPCDVYPRPLRFLLARSDAIVANSKAFGEDFLTLFPDLRDKMTVIHNGVDLAELDSPHSRAVLEAAPYVLCIAAHNAKKALDVLIRAFAQVAQTDPEPKLVLVGDGPLRGDLEALAASLELGARVVFAGEKERPEVVEWLQGCTLSVLPSRSEPFGIAIVEAMGCGKAVIGSRTGGIPEIITDGEDGLLVDPDDPDQLADAIRRLLADPELRLRLGTKARAKVRDRFLWEHMGRAYNKLFASLHQRQ